MRKAILALTAAAALGACQSIGGPIPDAPFRSTRTPAAQSAPSVPASPASEPARVAVSPRSAEQLLLDAERQLAADVQARGLGPALATAMDSQGFAVRSGGIYEGADAVQTGLATPAGVGPVFWQPDRVYVSGDGAMGLTSGRYVQVLQGQEAIQGRYVITWRKDGAGTWRVLSETRTADPPTPRPTAPAPAPRRRR